MDKRRFTIDAPISGTFYKQPSPEEGAYVQLGDKVKKKDVVCIVETMKIFNEVRAERPGVVREILIEDEDAVMTGQPMIVLEEI